MSDREFPKHFDGRRFYNPDAPQARGFLDVLQWKLTSRLEPSPEFISDVEQSTPPRRVESSELRITARGIFDRNKTLWCGYAIEFPERLVYFAGDTGFGNHFAQIREKFGSPQLALLPIGAYEPRWFMSPVHMAPEEAVRAHEILGAKTSIAIHHGTFQLADDGIDTPQIRLMGCRRDDSFLILKNGQFAEIP